MKKKLNSIEEKFIHFLQVVNLLGESEPIDLRYEVEQAFKKLGDDPPIDLQNRILRELLVKAVNSPFNRAEDVEMFCRFLFQKSGVDKINDLVYGIAVDSSEIDLFQAERIYNSFYVNLRIFHDTLHAFESNRVTGAKWSAQTLLPEMPVSLHLDSDRNVRLVVNENAVFYGFRDFKRVRKCPVCSNYFLALRTDAKYCSETCGTSVRQAALRTKKESKK